MSDAYFALRGVIEGFYGTFYTFPERQDLLRFLGQNGFNYYLYGPKNDRQHRMRWWDPYPAFILDQFADTIRIARESQVEFCYAISFGVPINYSSKEDFATVTAKLREMFDRGCRSFGLLLDDMTIAFAHEENRRHFPDVASAHADIANRLLDWARALDGSCRLFLCPSEYHGRPPFGDYVYTLGRGLAPDVDVFYTGPSIRSRTITLEDVEAFSGALGRAPVIWDNYPVNDLQMKAHVHVGPLRGRDAALYTVTHGFASNIMQQAAASKVALLTVAQYLRDPLRYEPDVAWQAALDGVVTEESRDPLLHFAENSLYSCLQDDEAPILTGLVSAALDALQAGATLASPPFEALAAYLTVLDESCYHLKCRMRNLDLRASLLPWIETLEDMLWMGRYALMALQAVEDGTESSARLTVMDGLLADVERNPRRMAGDSLLRLAQFAQQRVALAGPIAATTLRTAIMSEELLPAGDDAAARSFHQDAAPDRVEFGIAEAS